MAQPACIGLPENSVDGLSTASRSSARRAGRPPRGKPRFGRCVRPNPRSAAGCVVHACAPFGGGSKEGPGRVLLRGPTWKNQVPWTSCAQRRQLLLVNLRASNVQHADALRRQEWPTIPRWAHSACTHNAMQWWSKGRDSAGEGLGCPGGDLPTKQMLFSH